MKHTGLACLLACLTIQVNAADGQMDISDQRVGPILSSCGSSKEHVCGPGTMERIMSGNAWNRRVWDEAKFCASCVYKGAKWKVFGFPSAHALYCGFAPWVEESLDSAGMCNANGDYKIGSYVFMAHDGGIYLGKNGPGSGYTWDHQPQVQGSDATGFEEMQITLNPDGTATMVYKGTTWERPIPSGKGIDANTKFRFGCATNSVNSGFKGLEYILGPGAGGVTGGEVDWQCVRNTGPKDRNGKTVQDWCEDHNNLKDGDESNYEYLFNEGRDDKKNKLGVCGDLGLCWCCKRPRPASVCPSGTAKLASGICIDQEKQTLPQCSPTDSNAWNTVIAKCSARGASTCSLAQIEEYYSDSSVYASLGDMTGTWAYTSSVTSKVQGCGANEHVVFRDRDKHSQCHSNTGCFNGRYYRCCGEPGYTACKGTRLAGPCATATTCKESYYVELGQGIQCGGFALQCLATGPLCNPV